MNSTTADTTTATTGSVSLKTALLLDAAVTGANGLAYLAGAALLDSLLGPSPIHFVAIGAFLMVCAAILAVTGTRQPIPRGWATFAAEVNVAWAVGSIAAVVLGGAALAGGAGSYLGTLAGAYVIAIITSVLQFYGVSSFYKDLVQGSILLFAVALGAFALLRVRNRMDRL